MVCDLAGTERVKRSGVQGSQMREAQGISRSLQCLSEVVDALRHGRSHVPFTACLLTDNSQQQLYLLPLQILKLADEKRKDLT